MKDRWQDRTQQRRIFTRRAIVLGAVQCGAFGLLASKLYRIQVQDGAHYAGLADSNRTSTRLLAPPRAQILDRNGAKLAANNASWRALLVAEQTDDPSITLDAFSAIVPLDARERARIEKELNQSREFMPVLVRDFLTWDQMAALEVHAPDLPGIVVDAGQRRTYPHGKDCAHVIGYVAPPNEADEDRDAILKLPGVRVGRAGLEQQYDSVLRGQAGSVVWEVNAVGRMTRELSRQAGTPGPNIETTLDADLQSKVMALLGDLSASAVVLDCNDGGVLAMASTPSFDPGLFDAGITQASWAALNDNARAPLTNKAVAGLYPPGSTFKMAVGLAALQNGSLTAKEKIECPGYLDIGPMRFHCWKKGGHGMQDVHSALRNSCDVFFYETARRTGIDSIADMAHTLGLGVKPTIDLPGCHAGLIPTKEWRVAHGHQWNLGDTIISGIGQGFVQTTPLQLATYVARIATGRVIEPILRKGSAAPPLPLPNADHMAADLDLVRQGMWAVVNDPGATGYIAELPLDEITMAGKTGSAQVEHVSRELREHGHFESADLPWELRPHALFVCFAPFDAPRYAVAVVVEHGNAGAAVAAPLGRDIMMAALNKTAEPDSE